MRNQTDETHNSCGEHRDRLIAALAEAQHGQVARRQLDALGLSAREIEWRLKVGRLHRRHQGVYAVGHTVITQRGRWMAAVLAAGDRAVLSHRSAAALHGLGYERGRVEVTAPKERRRPGLTIRVSDVPKDERTIRDGIPVTTAARTLLDLAAVERRDRVEKALREAEVRELADATGVHELLDRYPGRPGTPLLRELMPRAQDGRTKSELEEAFLQFLDHHHLPRPLLNAHVAGKERDCVWLAQLLVVELDGWWTHGKAGFHADRRRDRRLLVAGFRTVRVTFDHLEHEPDDLQADLGALLTAAA